jgi:hypothetical protein
MDPPADGDELARVVPLRRRDRALTAAPGARGTLPRERAPFDPEIEPPDTPSRAAAGAALHSAHSALRLRRAPGPWDHTRAGGSRRPSRILLLTSAGGVGLVTVAALALFGSVLNSSPRSPAARVRSRATAGVLEPNKSGVLSASANPFDVWLDTTARTTGRTLALRLHRAVSRPSRKRSAPARSPSHASTTTNHQSAVAASYTPDTSGTSSHDGTAGTQAPQITTSTPSPVQTARPQQSTSIAQPASSPAPTTNRPDFGEQGLLGPGSSPDS